MKSSQINVIIIITHLKKKQRAEKSDISWLYYIYYYYYVQHNNLYENERALGEGKFRARQWKDELNTMTTRQQRRHVKWTELLLVSNYNVRVHKLFPKHIALPIARVLGYLCNREDIVFAHYIVFYVGSRIRKAQDKFFFF